MASATPVTPRVTQVSNPLAASHLADLATARVEHPPLFRLSACSAYRDTRIEFVKDAVSAYLYRSSLSSPTCVFLSCSFDRSSRCFLSSATSLSLSLSLLLVLSARFHPTSRWNPRNKAAVDVVHSSRR